MNKKERWKEKRVELYVQIILMIDKGREIRENREKEYYPEESKLREEYDKLWYEQMNMSDKLFKLFSELESISFS